MYLTYYEYQAFGGTLDNATFNEFEFEARALVDWVTFNRLQGQGNYPEAVKRCMYALIKYIQSQQATLAMPSSSSSPSGSSLQAGIASQSNDGVSISYNVLSASEIVSSSKDAMRDIIHQYLQGVTNELGRKVLYRGLYPGE